MTRMLVIAAKKNLLNRRLWEDEIVTEMSAQGVASTPSYSLFADSIPNPEQLGIAVRGKIFDGILFIRKLPTKISTHYVEASEKSVLTTRYNKHTQTYSTFYRNVEQPGYTDTSKVVRHEASVFSAQEGSRLVWACTGEMIDPNSRAEIRAEITGLIIPELAREGIIPKKQ